MLNDNRESGRIWAQCLLIQISCHFMLCLVGAKDSRTNHLFFSIFYTLKVYTGCKHNLELVCTKNAKWKNMHWISRTKFYLSLTEICKCMKNVEFGKFCLSHPGNLGKQKLIWTSCTSFLFRFVLEPCTCVALCRTGRGPSQSRYFSWSKNNKINVKNRNEVKIKFHPRSLSHYLP